VNEFQASPSLSLVIAVYERAEVLELVLASLLDQTHRSFEVIIADDGSGPGVARVVAAWQARLRQPLRHVWHEDQGFRKTIIVNRAVATARADDLVFIDGDCILHRRFLERHWARRRPGQALSGRRLMLDEELTSRIVLEDVTSRRIEDPRFWWRHVPPRDRRNGFCLPPAYGLRGLGSRRYEILGSNFSLPRDVFLGVNGYDERIQGRGMEDINLKTRLRNAGVAIRSVSQEAIQYHCFHTNSGFPHDAAAVARWGDTAETWTPFGIHPPQAGA
jgi:glycosyltransferase involved in cell wall biosynthesis